MMKIIYLVQKLPKRVICFNFFILVLFISVIMSCSGAESGKLTRQKTKALISNNKQLSVVKTVVILHEKGLQKGIEQEFWAKVKVDFISSRYDLTSKAKKYFAKVDYTSLDLMKHPSVHLKNPLDVELEVTGITDAPIGQNIKEAQFSWKYIDSPSVIKRFIVEGGTGAAYLRKYDDGWRIDELEYKYASEPALLTSKELEEEQKEIKEIQEAKRKREERERAEKERISALLSKSKNPTKKIFEMRKKVGSGHCNFIITDVNLSQLGWPCGGNMSVWFGDIKDFSTFFDSPTKVYTIKLKTRKGRTLKFFFLPNESDVIKAANVLSEAHKKWLNSYGEIVQKGLH